MKKNDIEFKLYSLKRYGNNSFSPLTLSDSLLIFRGYWDGYIAYKYIFRCAIVLGEPIVDTESIKNAIVDFKNWIDSKRLNVCLFVCTKNMDKFFVDLGFKKVCCGNELIIDLDKFNLIGPKKRSMRSSVYRAKRINLVVEEYKYYSNRCKIIENEIRRVSDEWCKIKKIPEPEFFIGKIDFKKEFGTRYFICKKMNKIVGFVKYSPIFKIKSYYCDVARREKNSPHGTIDYLLVKSFEFLKKEGIKKLYLGTAFYSFLLNDYTKYKNFNQRLFNISKPLFELFYPVDSGLFFKIRYATCWEPNYIYYYPRFSIRMLLSFIHAVYPGGIASIFINKIKHLLKNNYFTK
jgi:lysylphosphatidylglycerol synthetase-like protein (DUF2156 family)